MKGLNTLVKDPAGYFYIDDRLFASTQTKRLESWFDVLKYLFNQVILQKNVRKTARMA